MKTLSSFLSLVQVLAPAILWLSCSTKSQPLEIIRPVRYVKVYSTGGTRMRTFSGVAKSGIESNLSFKVAGTVQQVPVKVGDVVRRGQLLARLDPENSQLQVQKAEASHSQARAQQTRASADYDRVRALYENQNAAKSDLDAARAGFESTKASTEAAAKQLELARLQLSYTRLSAPSSGSIASVGVEVNENVQPGQPIVMLTAGSDIEVEVAIPEILISSIRPGHSATVTFDALEGRSFQAIVREVGVAATGFATTFPVTVRLHDQESGIRSGMASEVTLKLDTGDARERILVPPVAVAEDRQGRFVYVVRPVQGDTARVERINVQIGELTELGLEIFSGPADGDLVVTAGVSRISDGQKVRL